MLPQAAPAPPASPLTPSSDCELPGAETSPLPGATHERPRLRGELLWPPLWAFPLHPRPQPGSEAQAGLCCETRSHLRPSLPLGQPTPRQAAALPGPGAPRGRDSAGPPPLCACSRPGAAFPAALPTTVAVPQRPGLEGWRGASGRRALPSPGRATARQRSRPARRQYLSAS